MSDEGTIAGAMILSSPWPPLRPVEILSKDQGGTRVALVADTRGHLVVSLNRGSSVRTKQFGPLQIPGAARVILMLRWDPSRISLSVNAVELGDRVVGVQELGLPANQDVPPRGPMYEGLKAHSGLPEAERLFLETIADIDQKVLAGDRYSLIRASGLLRQLLVEEAPLAHVVNRRHQLDLEFLTVDFREPPPLAPESHWLNLDPTPFPGARTVTCTLRNFLAAPCLGWKGQTASVKDLIRACANAKGGIHLGRTKIASEQLLLDWDEAVRMLGEQPSLQAIAGVCRVALNGLRSLVTAIQQEAG